MTYNQCYETSYALGMRYMYLSVPLLTFRDTTRPRGADIVQEVQRIFPRGRERQHHMSRHHMQILKQDEKQQTPMFNVSAAKEFHSSTGNNLSSVLWCL